MKIERKVELRSKWHLELTDKEMSFIKAHMAKPVKTGIINSEELQDYELQREEFWKRLDTVKA